MAHPGFGDLVDRLVEAMGQNVAAVRPRDESILLQTPDGFLYVFVDDTSKLSLAEVQRLFQEVPDTPSKVVVLTPDRLPLALGTEVVRRGGTLVEGTRFTELAKGLGLGEQLGEPPRAAPDLHRGRLLPSARQLDEVLRRAETWQDWGVPALALRFYRQASDLKPEFAPAKVGVAHSLLALGLPMEANRAYDEVLHLHPDNVDARIGKAAVLGATGHPEKEIAEYRALLAENSDRSDLRAHLLAALLDARAWADARHEVEAMLRTVPDDPRLRFLRAVTLERLGEAPLAKTERERARGLGLPYHTERSLCEHLGLPVPPPRPPPDPVPRVTPRAPRKSSRVSPTRARTPPRTRSTPRPAKAKRRRAR
jgi:tetratricopeptide (TPR) repeat protein